MKILILLVFTLSILNADLKVGEMFPHFALKDQFEKNVEIPTKGRVSIIVSFEKDISESMQQFLSSKDKNFLSINSAIYIADVSAAPSFIFNLMVMPKLKELPYSMALIHDDKSELFNRKDKKISLFKLKNGQIVSIDFIGIEELGSSL